MSPGGASPEGAGRSHPGAVRSRGRTESDPDRQPSDEALQCTMSRLHQQTGQDGS